MGLFNLITQIITQINTFFDLCCLFLFSVIYWIKEGAQSLSNIGGWSSFRAYVVWSSRPTMPKVSWGCSPTLFLAELPLFRTVAASVFSQHDRPCSVKMFGRTQALCSLWLWLAVHSPEVEADSCVPLTRPVVTSSRCYYSEDLFRFYWNLFLFNSQTSKKSGMIVFSLWSYLYDIYQRILHFLITRIALFPVYHIYRLISIGNLDGI